MHATFPGPAENVDIAAGAVSAQPPTKMTPSWILTEDDLFFFRYVATNRLP